MNFESDDLSAYVNSVVEGVVKGLPGGFILRSPIKFEISVAKVKVAAGGFRVIVAEVGGKYGQEEVSKITFSSERKGRNSARKRTPEKAP
jgi:hypothetical protein